MLMTVAQELNLPSFHTNSGGLSVGSSLLPACPINLGSLERRSDSPDINITWSYGSSLFSVQAMSDQRKAIHGNTVEDL